MNKAALIPWWDHLRQVNGIALRLVEAIPEDQLDSHPIPKMRTPKELIVHMYATVREIAHGLVTGRIRDFEQDPMPVRTKAELIAFCRQCWADGSNDVASATDAQIAATVETPWGVSFPGFAAVGIIQDEFLHHRGQLFCYVRALGHEVPEMWDFRHNAPEYQPKQPATA